MNCTINEEHLDDYVDGMLTEQQRIETKRHLESCETCRQTVKFLRALQATADAMPREIEPGRDLWTDLEARISPTRVMQVDFRGRGPLALLGVRSVWGQWAALAAAALVLVVASSGITAYFVGDSELGAGAGMPGLTGVGEPVASTIEEFRPAEIGYAQAIGDLLQTLDARREDLDPETLTVIEANLRVIDAAIRRARAAIEKYPEESELALVLADNYRRKLEFLERTNLLIERS
jgi:hypothetical protein